MVRLCEVRTGINVCTTRRRRKEEDEDEEEEECALDIRAYIRGLMKYLSHLM
jgi:hypothetical protein